MTDLLRDPKEVRLAAGTIRYHEVGPADAPPIVFVHGLLVNANLWRKVIPPLAGRFRCIAPTWPLGSHDVPMDPGADLRIPTLARLVADFLAALDLEDATLVGNDTGGALCQLVVADHAERVGRLVLTNCDAFDNFLPLRFRYMQWGAHVPGFVFLMAQTMRIRALRRLPIAYGPLTKRPIDAEASDSYVRPVLTSRGARRDVAKVLADISPAYTNAAAERLRGFRGPVLICWATEDALFPFEHAERLAKAFKQARVEKIDDSSTFIPEDQPGRLAERIAAFMP